MGDPIRIIAFDDGPVSGRLDDVVFRTIRGKTHMYVCPQASAKEPSPAQLAQRARFGRAAKVRGAKTTK